MENNISNTPGETRRQDRRRIRHAGIEMSLLNDSELNVLLDAYFENIDDEQRAKFIDKVIKYQFKDRGKWDKIEKWMESTVNNHPDYIPRRVAHLACAFWNIPFSMLPFLSKKARLVKRRVSKRKRYAILKEISNDC